MISTTEHILMLNVTDAIHAQMKPNFYYIYTTLLYFNKWCIIKLKR